MFGMLNADFIEVGAAFSIDSELSADGDPFAFFNWDVENGHNGADCACKAMAKGHQQSLQSFLIAEGAAIEKGIHGSLDLCASGGIAATLSTQALGSLKGWLSSSKCSIKSDLLDAVKGWCAIAKSDGYGSAHGKDHGGPNVVLSRSYQTKLSNFCGDSAFEGLDFPIQAGLKACASGGVAGSLDTSIQSAVSGFIKSKSCPLDSDLSASIGFWLSGQTGKGCESGTPPDAYGYISAGFAISGNLDTSGSLTAEAQASLSGFCGKAGAYVDASILNSLKHCAKGGLSAELGIGASADLSAWLGSSECSLDSELRASVMAWMSAGISGAGGAGGGISGGAGFAFDASAIGSISAGINASGKLSSTVKGALGVCTAGGVAGSVDFDARAELGAFLCSEDGTSVGVDIQGQLMGWLCGSDNSSHGSYKGHRSGKGLQG
jgi:hypothetical protein